MNSKGGIFKGNNPAIITRVDRGSDGDAIDIQDKVENLIKKFQLNMPETLTIELSGTRTEAIKNRLNILISNGVVGLILVYFSFSVSQCRNSFLGCCWNSSCAFCLFWLYVPIGISINMISLFALIICLGIVWMTQLW